MRRLFISLLTFALVTFGLLPASANAQLDAFKAGKASSIYGCYDGEVCVYRWTNYNTNGGYIRLSLYTLNAPSNYCTSLNSYQFPNGQSVADNSGSIIMNVGPVNSGQGASQFYQFFDWPNCNGNGNYFRMYTIDNPDLIPHLSNISTSRLWGSNDWDAYHQVYSIRSYNHY